jgi:hypothetical protein
LITESAKNRASTHAVGIRRGDRLAGSGDNAVPFFKTQMNLGGTNLDYGAAIRVFNSLCLSLAMASSILRFGKTDKLSIFAIRCFRMRCINKKARSSQVDHVLGGAEKNLARNINRDSTAKRLSVVLTCTKVVAWRKRAA